MLLLSFSYSIKRMSLANDLGITEMFVRVCVFQI